MDDIVSSTNSTFTDQKKRHSDEENCTISMDTVTAQRFSTVKKLANSNAGTTAAADTHHYHLQPPSWSENPKRGGHHRTSSTQYGSHQQQMGANKAGQFHGRRGSLPPVLKLHAQQGTNKLSNVDFSPIARSPYSTATPTLPEKTGSVAIHISHPMKSDLLGRHLIQPQHENMLKNLMYIFLWYFFSTTLSLYNKNLMGRDRFNFQFPLLVSAIHAGLHSVITFLMMTFGGDRWRTVPSNSPSAVVISTVAPVTAGSSSSSSSSTCSPAPLPSASSSLTSAPSVSGSGQRIKSSSSISASASPSASASASASNHGSLTTHNYLYKVIPCGVAAAIEICCANASLVFITLSFYTMVKSSTPVWVLLFSFLFGFEKPRLALVAIITVIVFGVFLTVEGETKFDMVGFSLVLVASVVSGLRWNLTQLLLQQDRLGMNTPIATLYYLSPIMFVTMLFLSLVVENPIEQFRQSVHFDNLYHILESFGLMAIGGLLAFAMLLAEFALIKSTNTVTLSVAGISKEIVVISLSVAIYGDVLTSKNIIGLFVSIAGIIGYNYYKLSKTQQSDKGQYQMIPMTVARKLED